MSDQVSKIIGDDNKTEAVAENIEKITEGKYKSAADLAKAYKDLEKKLGEVSEETKKSREFAQMVSPILDEIRNDPEIFEKLDKKIREKNDPNAKKETKDDKKEERSNIEARETMSNIIVSRFEESHGFSDLSNEEKVELRNKIGSEILDLTGLKLEQIDLRRQEQILEKAYKLVKQDNKKTSQDETESDTTSDGAIGSIKSSQGKGATVLTSEEAKVASALGLTREQYLSGKRK